MLPFNDLGLAISMCVNFLLNEWQGGWWDMGLVLKVSSFWSSNF